MTPRERLLTVIRGGIPDCVPMAPDISNMIPAKLTGLPIWEAYIAAAGAVPHIPHGGPPGRAALP